MSSELEYLDIELRTHEGRIFGRLASFGEVAHGSKGPETLSPGAIDTSVSVPLVDGHEMVGGIPQIGPAIGTLEVRMGPDGYDMEAVPASDPYSQQVYEELRSGKRTSKLSIGFRALAERVVDGIRRLDQLALGHVALVPAGAYPSATVTEVRTATGETMEQATETVETTDAPPVVDTSDEVRQHVALVDEIRSLKDEVIELRRKQDATQNVRIIDSPDTPWSPEEIRTAGHWLYHSVRATEAYDWVTPQMAALSLEALGGNLDEIRAVTSSPVSGMGAAVPDQYLGPIVDLYYAGQPFLQALGSLPLPPDGMDIHRPVVTQGSLVAWEASEGDEPSSQAVTIGDQTGAIKALKSAMKATMQTALRTNPSAVDAMLRDQAEAMGTEMGNSAINGTGTLTSQLGELAGVLANGSITTGTAISSFTAANLVQSIADALVTIRSTVKGTRRSDIFIVMAPRRWGDTLALVDGQNRPIMNVDNLPAQNTLGDATEFFGGSILNFPIIVDDNIPENLGGGTNQDCILVVSKRSFEFYSGGRMAASWQDPATFQTTYGAAQMAALIPVKPGALVSITGTGLV